jgi:hypothetical protein
MMLGNRILTLQTYNRWRLCKVGQILFVKSVFHLSVEELWASVTTLILQLHHDIAPELVILREYCYYRN